VIRIFRVPLTAHERELLLGFAIEDLDLARHLRLVPAVDGWVTVSLSLDELESLMWIGCQGGGKGVDSAEGREVLPALGRMSRVLHGEPALPDPEPAPPRPALSLWRPGGPGLVLKGIAVQFSSRDRRCLERHRDLLEDLPPKLRDTLAAESSASASLLFGEALLLMDLLEETAMAGKTADLVAYDLLAVHRRIEDGLDQQWAPLQPGAWYVRKVGVSPDQRIPVALRRSEAELLRALALPPTMARALEVDESGLSSRTSLTLEQVEQLLGDILVRLEEERVARLEQRLEYVQRCFTDGREY